MLRVGGRRRARSSRGGARTVRASVRVTLIERDALTGALIAAGRRLLSSLGRRFPASSQTRNSVTVNPTVPDC